MLTNRQLILHYLSLLGVLLSIVEAFVFFFYMDSYALSSVLVFNAFLYIIVNILNVGKNQILARTTYFIATVISILIGSTFSLPGNGIIVYFIPIVLISFTLFDRNENKWNKIISICIFSFGVFFSILLEGSYPLLMLDERTIEFWHHFHFCTALILSLLSFFYVRKDTNLKALDYKISKLKMEAIANSFAESIIILNELGSIISFNDIALKNTFNKQGLKLSLYSPIEKYIDANYLDEFSLQLKKCFDTNQEIVNERIIIKGENQKSYIEYKFVPFGLTSETEKGVIIHELDISQRRIGEEEIKQQKFMLEVLFNQSPDALFLVSPNSRKIVSNNHTANELFAIDHDYMYASYTQLFNIDQGKVFWNELEQKLLDEKEVEFELECKTQTNKIFLGAVYFKRFLVNGINHDLIRVADITQKSIERQNRIDYLELKRQNIENKLKQKNIALLIHGQELERQRIAKELHDGIGQMLTALRLQTIGIKNKLKTESVDLDSSKDLIDHTIQEVKRISNNLMPSAIEDFGLIEALQNMFSYIKNEIEVSFSYADTYSFLKIPQNHEIAIFRIIQEAINNAIKYANVQKIDVSISYLDIKTLKIEITDFGKGFIIDKVIGNYANKSLGNGINNMKERASLINGTIEIYSELGKGTRILLTLPFS